VTVSDAPNARNRLRSLKEICHYEGDGMASLRRSAARFIAALAAQPPEQAHRDMLALS
jgi:hypothetical protein